MKTIAKYSTIRYKYETEKNYRTTFNRETYQVCWVYDLGYFTKRHGYSIHSFTLDWLFFKWNELHMLEWNIGIE